MTHSRDHHLRSRSAQALRLFTTLLWSLSPENALLSFKAFSALESVLEKSQHHLPLPFASACFQGAKSWCRKICDWLHLKFMPTNLKQAWKTADSFMFSSLPKIMISTVFCLLNLANFSLTVFSANDLPSYFITKREVLSHEHLQLPTPKLPAAQLHPSVPCLPFPNYRESSFKGLFSSPPPPILLLSLFSKTVLEKVICLYFYSWHHQCRQQNSVTDCSSNIWAQMNG